MNYGFYTLIALASELDTKFSLSFFPRVNFFHSLYVMHKLYVVPMIGQLICGNEMYQLGLRDRKNYVGDISKIRR